MVLVNLVEASKAQDALRVESKRVRLEPVDLRDPDILRTVLGRRRRAGAASGLDVARIVERRDEPFEARVAGDAAGHRLQPQPEARCDGRRTFVSARPSDERPRGAEGP